jgi:hypothetical protein
MTALTDRWADVAVRFVNRPGEVTLLPAAPMDVEQVEHEVRMGRAERKWFPDGKRDVLRVRRLRR